jgi:hypothetical protein
MENPFATFFHFKAIITEAQLRQRHRFGPFARFQMRNERR